MSAMILAQRSLRSAALRSNLFFAAARSTSTYATSCNYNHTATSSLQQHALTPTTSLLAQNSLLPLSAQTVFTRGMADSLQTAKPPTDTFMALKVTHAE